MLSLWLPATIRTEEEAPFSSDAFADFVPDLEEPALDEPVLPEALEAVVFTTSPVTAPEANSKLQLSVSPVSLFVSAKAAVPEKIRFPGSEPQESHIRFFPHHVTFLRQIDDRQQAVILDHFKASVKAVG